MPRVAWSRLSGTPEQLSRGPRVLGISLIVRTIARPFYVELVFDQTRIRGANAHGTQKNERVVLPGGRVSSISGSTGSGIVLPGAVGPTAPG